ncbi:MAG: hypothetical protein JST89_13665 [Cyanobacteria bacterium SZAS-4]|nr:hypothetical protein [Cyanobacteria bacterium SZAS-4]
MSELLTTVLMQRSKIKNTTQAMRANADYVLGELPKLDVPKDDKLRTEKTLNDFKNFVDELAPIMRHVDEMIGRFLDAPEARVAKTIKEVIGSIEFGPPFGGLHKLVTSLRDTDGVLNILVTESVTNILIADQELLEAAIGMLNTFEQVLLDLNNGSVSVDSFGLPCSLCGHNDCVSFCVVDSDGHHPFYAVSQEAGTGSLVVNHGETILRLRAERLQSIRAAILNRDIKPLLELLESGYPFCSKCSLAFCTEHWTNTETVFDDGFYDCTYATCPNGHRIMIDD